jgi:hypothetical protein
MTLQGNRTFLYIECLVSYEHLPLSPNIRFDSLKTLETLETDQNGQELCNTKGIRSITE